MSSAIKASFLSWLINLEKKLVINWSLLRIENPVNLQEIQLKYWKKKTIINDKRKLVERREEKNAKKDRKYFSGCAAKDKRQKRIGATAKEIN